VAEGISNLNLREKRTILNRISILARVNLTHTLGTSKDHSEATVSLIFWVMDQGHHKQLQNRTHNNCAGHTSVARLHDRTPVCYAERTPTRRCVYTTEIKIIEWWRHVHLRANQVLGLPLYHISRHVASTFKCLATTTTHFDLINIYQQRWGNLSSHDNAHDPVHHPYSDCRIINIQLLYRMSDRKSTDFCRSY
jgi:hypothetical protein